MALNGVYKFLYFFLIKKIPIKDVPSGLEDDVFELEGVELGKYALQLPPPSDNKVSPDGDSETAGTKSKAQYSVDLSAIELSPLIQKIESQISDNVGRLNAVDSRFNETDSRFNAVDSRFDVMDSRFDGVDSKLKGILEALSQLPK